MPHSYADPRSDIAFKKIFGSEQHTSILISFLNSILDFTGDETIVSVEVVNPYQVPRLEFLKSTTLDVKARDLAGRSFIVEMQVEPQEFFGKRALYYTSKSYTDQLPRGGDYKTLKPVYFVGILNFSIFSGTNPVTRHTIRNEETLQHEIKDFSLNFVELTKFSKSIYDLKTLADKWIWFMKHGGDISSIPLELSEELPIIEAFSIADQHLWSAEELDVYEYWLMKEHSVEDSIQYAAKLAKKEGKIEGKIETARAMDAEKINHDIIEKVTGLFPDQWA